MRVVVVGGGLAGCVTALALAGRGAEVSLVRAGPGATALTGGALDVASASPLRRGGLRLGGAGAEDLGPAARLQAIAIANPAHPYARLLADRSLERDLQEATAALDGWLEPGGLRILGDGERRLWLADVRGALRQADWAFSGPGEGDLSAAGEIALIALPGLEGWDAAPALRLLAGELEAVGLAGRSLRLIKLALPEALLANGGTPERVARRIESRDGLEVLRAALAPAGREGRLLLLPPILGLERVADILGALREATGTRVAEALGTLPLTIAGYRLDRALGNALEAAGVEVHHDRARELRTDSYGVRGVELASSDVGSLSADAVVLATGRFVAGGLVDREGHLEEPLAGLPLYDPAGRRVDGWKPARLVRRDYEGEQPLFAAGVRSDSVLRPLGVDGRPWLANLFVAGDLLGSFDPARDRTGLGVALLTGWLAAQQVAARVGSRVPETRCSAAHRVGPGPAAC